MSTTATFAAVSASNNAAAQAAAARAKVERCTMEVSNFINDGSTLEQKRSFSDCVNTLWPQAFSSGEIQSLKILVFVLLLSFVGGIFFGWKADGWMGAVIGAIIAPAGVAFAAGAAALIWFGAAFLFS